MNTTVAGSRSISSYRPLSVYIASNYVKLMETDKFCDVTFVIGEHQKEYPGIKALFAIHSCVFETMLYGSMMESCMNRIEIKDINEDAFEFLRLFCYGLDPELTAQNVVGILQCSDKYLIEPLKKACIEFIGSISISSRGSSSDFLMLIIELSKYNLSDKIVEIIDQVKLNTVKLNDHDNDNDNDRVGISDEDEKSSPEPCIDYEEILNNPLLMKLNKDGFVGLVLKSAIFDNPRKVSREKLWICCVKWAKHFCQRKENELKHLSIEDHDDEEEDDIDDHKRTSVVNPRKDLKNDERSLLHSFLPFFDFKAMSAQFFLDYVMPLNILSTDLKFAILRSHIHQTLQIVEKHVDMNRLNFEEQQLVRNHHFLNDMDCIRFNIYNTKHSFVSSDFKKLKTKAIGKNVSCKTIVFISDFGFQNGVHRWAIKSHDSSSGYNAIGVVSNYECINDDQDYDFYVNWPDHVYVYYTNGDIDHRKDGKKAYSISSKKKWGTGDTITVCLDCNQWKLAFQKDGMLIADPIDITPNTRYYPALRCCTCKGHEYEVLI